VGWRRHSAKGDGGAAVHALRSDQCEVFEVFTDTDVNTERMIGADAATKTPAFCEVPGVSSPAESLLTVVYRLPESWKAKLGWDSGRRRVGAGNLAIDRPVRTAVGGCGKPGGKNYATAPTDGGHTRTDQWDTSWALQS